MKVIKTINPDILIFKPQVFRDDRGSFFESFNQNIFDDAIGRKVNFVQDNHSESCRGVLRGLHYQLAHHAQGKLIRCIFGEVFDVAVDIRKSLRTFGQWVGAYLSAENKLQLWIPEGFAHGFLVLSENAELVYKTTNYYHPPSERILRYDDPDINIQWPNNNFTLKISKKDKEAKLLVSTLDSELFE